MWEHDATEVAYKNGYEAGYNKGVKDMAEKIKRKNRTSDCAFDEGKRKCHALTEKNCICCHFRKTTEEVEEGQKKANKRIASLPDEQRDRINKKYKGF